MCGRSIGNQKRSRKWISYQNDQRRRVRKCLQNCLAGQGKNVEGNDEKDGSVIEKTKVLVIGHGRWKERSW